MDAGSVVTEIDPKDQPATAVRILDASERLAQRRGFNGFSYADVAVELGITKAAMHYHFATKAELGRALMARYHDRFTVALDRIESEVPDPLAQLNAYVDLYSSTILDGRMCLCGMLAAEFQTLPAVVQATVVEFLDNNVRWLTGVLERGRDQSVLVFAGLPGDVAQMVLSGLEGALLIARVYDDERRFRGAAELVLAGLHSGSPASHR